MGRSSPPRPATREHTPRPPTRRRDDPRATSERGPTFPAERAHCARAPPRPTGGGALTLPRRGPLRGGDRPPARARLHRPWAELDLSPTRRHEEVAARHPRPPPRSRPPPLPRLRRPTRRAVTRPRNARMGTPRPVPPELT